jgi:hypothetical protein
MLKDVEPVSTLDTLIVMGHLDEVARAGAYDRPQQLLCGSSRIAMASGYSGFDLGGLDAAVAFTIDLVIALANAWNLLETSR